jgi:hypothetical protein
MATTYHYEIVSLTTKDIGDQADVVKKIEYSFNGTDEDTGYAADVFDSIVLDDPADFTSFTEYSELTKEQVQGWLSALIEDSKEAEYKAKVDEMIEEYTSYNDVAPLPWAESYETPEITEPAESTTPDEQLAAALAADPGSDAVVTDDDEMDAGAAQDAADAEASA